MLAPTKTTKIATLLLVTLLAPSLSMADRLLKAKSGVQLCPGSDKGSYTLRNPNSQIVKVTKVKRTLKITKIEITDGNGTVGMIWEAGDAMPVGMRTDGQLSNRGGAEVKASDMVAGASFPKNTKGPYQAFVYWKAINNLKKAVVQPVISLTRNYDGTPSDSSDPTTGSRSSSCKNL